jgi:hypothetical protein
VRSFGAGESAALADYNALVEELNANRIASREAANRLEYTILPEWQRTSAAFEAQVQSWKQRQTPTDLQERLVALFERTVSSRQEGWTRMIAALRAGDNSAFVQISNGMEATMKDVLQQIRSLDQS